MNRSDLGARSHVRAFSVSGQRERLRNVGMSWPKGVGSERAASLGRANGPAPRRVTLAAPKPKKAPFASALASGFLVSP